MREGCQFKLPVPHPFSFFLFYFYYEFLIFIRSVSSLSSCVLLFLICISSTCKDHSHSISCHSRFNPNSSSRAPVIEALINRSESPLWELGRSGRSGKPDAER